MRRKEAASLEGFDHYGSLSWVSLIGKGFLPQRGGGLPRTGSINANLPSPSGRLRGSPQRLNLAPGSTPPGIPGHEEDHRAKGASQFQFAKRGRIRGTSELPSSSSKSNSRRENRSAADNRPTGTAGYDDPSRWDDPNAAARCQTPADYLTGAAGADQTQTGPGVPAGAKGLLLQAPEGMAAATTSGVSCRAGRASTAAW
eukprot:scaffold36274_cov125-Isochrysis_galbana.AAC.9